MTIWLARCWPTYTLDKYMVVEAKFETMITNDSCFVAVSCLVVFCCWKLNYSSFHISPFFPVSSISFSKVQIMITTTSRRPPAYTNFIGTNRKLNLKKSFEKRGYFWKKCMLKWEKRTPQVIFRKFWKWHILQGLNCLSWEHCNH